MRAYELTVKLVLCVACLLMGIGIYFKYTYASPENSNSTINSVQQIDNYPFKEDFEILTVTSDGSRKVFTYAPQNCRGRLFVLPIYRNAEDAALLASWSLEPYFVFKSQLLETFPSFRFASSKLIHRLSLEHIDRPIVYAIAEQGKCEIAKQIIPLLQNATRISE